MLKRGPIIVIGIVVVLLLSAPLAIGMFIEGGLRDQIEIYDRNAAWSASVENYEQGWLDSRANVNIGLSPAYLEQMAAVDPSMSIATMLGDLSIPIIVDFSHGPLLLDGGFGVGSATVRAYVDPESPMVALAEQVLGMPYLFELRGRGGFGTGFRFEGEIPPAENAFPDGSYTFSGLQFSGTSDDGNLVLDAVIDSLSLQSAFLSAILESMTVAYDYRYRPDRIGLGDFELAIASIVASNPLLGSEPLLSADGVRIGSTVTEHEGGAHVDMHVTIDLDGLSVIDAFSVSDTALGVSFEHFDSAAMFDLKNLTTTMPPGADEAQVLALMRPIFDRIVAGDPALSLEPMRFSMPAGDFDGKLDVALDSSVLPNGSVADLENPQIAMEAISANLELTCSKTLAKDLMTLSLSQQMAAQMGPDAPPLPPEQVEAMVDQQFAALVAQGMLTDNGDTYSTTIVFADGVATVNGTALPLGAMGLF